MSHHHHLGDDLASLSTGGKEIPPARRAELELHAASCPACRHALDESSRVLEAISIPRFDLGPAFDAAMRARLDAIDRARASRPAGRLLERLAALFTVPGAATALAAAAVAAAFLLLFAPDRSDPEGFEGALFGGNPELLSMIEDLDLYRDYEVVENIDILEDLDVIASLDEGAPG